jgi:hypothetical protein
MHSGRETAFPESEPTLGSPESGDRRGISHDGACMRAPSQSGHFEDARMIGCLYGEVLRRSR